MKADVREIFSSIQGEGIYLGKRQIFVRFADCNSFCGYCDEKIGRAIASSSRRLSLSLFSVYDAILRLDKKEGPHEGISFTGGEPLAYADFLKALLPKLFKFRQKLKRRFQIYLETNGTLPSELAKVINFVDVVAMDIKLPSVTGYKPYWDEHEDFLRIASKKDVFVKLILSERCSLSDIMKAGSIVKRIDKKIPIVLQPIIANGKVADKLIVLLLKYQKLLRKGISDVRIIPQTHKLLGVR